MPRRQGEKGHVEMVTLALVWISRIASVCAQFDNYSLPLLVAVAVLSYLFGYLYGQMQFPDSPSAGGKLPRKQTPKDLS